MLNSIAFSTSSRIDFYQEVEDLLEVDVDILTAYMEVAKGHRELGLLGRSKYDIINAWHDDLSRGSVASMKKHVTAGEFLILSTLPETTDPTKILEEARKLATKLGAISKTIIVNLMLPVVNLSLFLGVSYYAGAELIPAFDKLIPINEWPLSSYLTAQYCLFIHEHILQILLFLLIIGVVIKYSLTNWIGFGRVKADGYFPYSIYKINSGVGLIIGLASLMKSGAGRDDSKTLHTLARHSSAYTKSRVKSISRKMEAGYNIGEAMLFSSQNYPDRNVIRQIKLISGKEGFEDRLSKIADRWSDRSVEVIKAKMNTIGHLLLVLTMALVINLVIGVAGIIEKF